MKILDYVLIGLYVVITFVIAIIMLKPPSGEIDSYYMEIQINNEIYKRVELPVSEETVIEIDNEYGHNIITVRGMSVVMTYADCNDQVCVRQGEILKVASVIACLPSKLIVEIKGKTADDTVDVISH
ncbi:MAG: NusG domain II-containing protein [Acidaminobacteraceae bacterium]